jgi:hypothetical protein
VTPAAPSSTARAAPSASCPPWRIAPLAGSNGVSDLAKSLDYANSKGGAGVTLVQGGAFDGNLAVVRGLLG